MQSKLPKPAPKERRIWKVKAPPETENCIDAVQVNTRLFWPMDNWGAKGGAAGRGKSKAGTPEMKRAAATARWGKPGSKTIASEQASAAALARWAKARALRRRKAIARYQATLKEIGDTEAAVLAGIEVTKRKLKISKLK